MSVHLIPNNALGFNRPFSTLVKRVLTVVNNNSQPVAFKVKTTAPKLYCVRPNSGRIEPGESIDVSVMLQPMKDEPPLSTKCKDKFLIQSTLITPDKETKGLQDIWNVADGGEEWKVYQQKLRVVYLPPEGQPIEEEDEGHLAQPAGLSPGDSRYATVKQHPSNGHSVGPTPQFLYEEENSDLPRPGEPEYPGTPPPQQADYTVAREDSHEEQPPLERSTSGVGIVNVNVHSSSPPPSPPKAPEPSLNRELQAKYDEAQAEIQRLRALLAAVPDPSSIAPESVAPSTIRQRHNSGMSDDGSTYAGTEFVGTEYARTDYTGTDYPRTEYARTEVGSTVDSGVMIHQDGVPLQVVIILALGVFITTYLFF
ncbi:PapD-like protein [Hygrophoropsis aurantiaca]|uniref:PapD-like protein n=1 Tax=Hygrophoropsis aurantiaca TaxID=72124 RepID=A0ACB8AQ34_9AGAM|nr:PapD-like protein [Hygrophoropsis aurantiaca]